MGNHMSGLGALFQLRGIEGINTAGLRELYYELRPTEVNNPSPGTQWRTQLEFCSLRISTTRLVIEYSHKY